MYGRVPFHEITYQLIVVDIPLVGICDDTIGLDELKQWIKMNRQILRYIEETRIRVEIRSKFRYPITAKTREIDFFKDHARQHMMRIPSGPPYVLTSFVGKEPILSQLL